MVLQEQFKASRVVCDCVSGECGWVGSGDGSMSLSLGVTAVLLWGLSRESGASVSLTQLSPDMSPHCDY